MVKTSDQIEIVARRKKGTKTEEEKKKKKKNQSLSQSNKGNNNTTTKKKKSDKNVSDNNEPQNKDESEGLVAPDSQDEVVEDSYEDHANKEEKSNGVANQRSKKAKNGKEKTDLVTTTTTTKKKKNIKNKEEEESESGSTWNCFPMSRMNRMIKSEDPHIRISQESVLLINKASEKFLELFCKEAYACAFLDHKNHVSYKHLSSVVSKRKRFDFLSDFVPEKVKAEDAIAEVPVAET